MISLAGKLQDMAFSLSELLLILVLRSTGYGSVEVWIRHLRQGITFQETYAASDQCAKSGWAGSSFTIGGGYVWGDVYAEANKRDVVVVGGGDPVTTSHHSPHCPY
jgi:hypothetical protein